MLISAYWGQLERHKTERKSKISSITIISLGLHFPAAFIAWKNLIPTLNFNMSILQTQIKKNNNNFRNTGPKIYLNLVRVRDDKYLFLLLVSSLPAPLACSYCIRRVSGIHFLCGPAQAQIIKIQKAVRDAFVCSGSQFTPRVAPSMGYNGCKGLK